MASQRLTDKTALANNPTKEDLLMVVDASDTTGSAAGTSKKVISPYLIGTEVTDISNAAYLAMDTSPVTLVTNVAGKIIIPISIHIQYTEGATANIAATNLYVGHETISTAYFTSFVKSFSVSPNYNAMSWILPIMSNNVGSNNLTLENKKLICWFNASPTATATGTMKVFTSYRLLEP